MKVGFIGLGSMGAGMSRNLIKAGHDLVVYNRTRSLAQEMRSLGTQISILPTDDGYSLFHSAQNRRKKPPSISTYS